MKEPGLDMVQYTGPGPVHSRARILPVGTDLDLPWRVSGLWKGVLRLSSRGYLAEW